MQNYPLLRRAGKSRKPVLLKARPVSDTRGALLAAEYLLARENRNVIRANGDPHFLPITRATHSHQHRAGAEGAYPSAVIVDPSHASGKREMVVPLARAAFAAPLMGSSSKCIRIPTRRFTTGRKSLNLELFAD